MKYDNRSHRGFAFVEFTTAEQASAAKSALGSSHLYGRKLVLEFSDEAVESVDAMREKAKRVLEDSNVKANLKKRINIGEDDADEREKD
jgi:multiple RNA-binding domain-containing protein 1